ncbi:Ctf8-domain-containing protein [Cantharellus anzutake]|uniref:Ctf8-domain-containing protein n=1 Tax=Cantharellus anzutake TaxID=1750568 RepID=UPI001903214E|nr:Ctf8-domain-containing protein [Cantharellus anzutake]KAF8340443.1 Ctf8-domain-containing protein [Cantharellus anzutake]
MLIPINLPASVPSRYPHLPPSLLEFGNEVVIIELQGELVTGGNSDGQVVGTLVIHSETKKPMLRIGHHLLEGSIQKLPKAYAVLARPSSNDEIVLPKRRKLRLSPDSVHEDEDVEGDAQGPDDSSIAEDFPEDTGEDTNTAYDMIAIVKKKLVFSKRPVPIVPSTTNFETNVPA